MLAAPSVISRDKYCSVRYAGCPASYSGGNLEVVSSGHSPHMENTQARSSTRLVVCGTIASHSGASSAASSSGSNGSLRSWNLSTREGPSGRLWCLFMTADPVRRAAVRGAERRTAVRDGP
jgi:hypothetical protein